MGDGAGATEATHTHTDCRSAAPLTGTGRRGGEPLISRVPARPDHLGEAALCGGGTAPWAAPIVRAAFNGRCPIVALMVLQEGVV